MKVALLLLVAFVGASMARPNVDRKELMNLLQRYLNERDDDEAPKRDPRDSTLFDDMGLPGDILSEFTKEFTNLSPKFDGPLQVDANSISGNKEKIGNVIDNIEGIIRDAANKIGDLPENLSLKEIFEGIRDQVLPGIYDHWMETGPAVDRGYKDLIKGAIRGTKGAANEEDDEPGCDFGDDGDDDGEDDGEDESEVKRDDKGDGKGDGKGKDKGKAIRLLKCGVDKSTAAQVAVEIFTDILHQRLGAGIDGKEMRSCLQLEMFLSANEEIPEEAAPQLREELEATLACIGDNMNVVRSALEIIVAGPNGEFSQKPLPTKVRFVSVLNYILGNFFWAEEAVWDAFERTEEEIPEAEKKKREKVHSLVNKAALNHARRYYKN